MATPSHAAELHSGNGANHDIDLDYYESLMDSDSLAAQEGAR